MNARTPHFYDALTAEPMAGVPADCWRLDDGAASSYLVGPAFFDPQVNGFGGIDFQDPEISGEALEHAAEQLRRAGCAHFLLTIITAEERFLESHLRRLHELIAASPLLREAIPGLHLEGPFISPDRGYAAAHPAECACAPDWTKFQRWQSASGERIRVVTLAPEWETTTAFIRQAVAAGVFVCLGHTNATRAQLAAAAEAGARMMTHLGNGCPQLLHRHDNIIQRVLSIPELMASLVPDGIHVAAPALANLVRGLGPARVVMMTDAASPAGAPNGTYRLGRLELRVGDDRIVRRPEGEGFAGSALTPVEGFYNCIRFGGMSVDAAWHAWTRLRGMLFPGLNTPHLMLPFSL